MIRSSRDTSGQRKLGPVGWVSLFILLVASGTLLYYISEGGLGSADPTTQSSTVHTAQSSSPRPVADSPSRSSESSTSARANYTPAASPQPDERSGGRSRNASGSSESSDPEPTASSSSRVDRSFTEHTQATRLVNIFHGESSGKTPSFEVSDVWTLEWETRGSIFQVFVHDQTGNLHTVAVNNSGMGQGGHSGEVELETPGTYRLKVNALSTWRIRIVQGK